MIIEVATTIDTTTDFDTGIATYEAWVEWLDEWLLTAPEGMVWHHTRHCNVCVHDTNRTLDGSSEIRVCCGPRCVPLLLLAEDYSPGGLCWHLLVTHHSC